MAALSPELQRRMVEIGALWTSDLAAHRDEVLAVYAALLAQSPKQGVAVRRDLAYGRHPRQRLDLFLPSAGAAPAPVAVFVHGGAFVRGDKRVNEEIYDNVLYYFARRGCVGVNLEYRLATEAPYPGGGEDVALALAWLRANVGRFGGDPDAVFLIGHSAGGTHIATWACDPALADRRGPDAAGLVLISARLRADTRPENPNAAAVRAYFGPDESKYEERSPVAWAERLRMPVMLAVAEFENPLLDVYGAEFFWRVAAARGRAPRFLRLARHNHISIVAHFNTEEDILGDEILDFMAEVRG